MQATKKSMNRNGPLEAPQKTSPTAQYVTGSESDTTSSTCTNTSTPTKKKSPKFIERRSPGSPASERKHRARINELEIRISALEEELKKTKNELATSESLERRAQQESEEAKKHLMVITAKLEETQNQLQELSESENDRILELRKLGRERDRAWQSEIEAMQQQHKLDSSALASATVEMQRLRMQLEKVASSRAAYAARAEIANSELCTLKEAMTEERSYLKALRRQIQEIQGSEAMHQVSVNEKDLQLEAAEATVERLQADSVKMMDSLSSLSLELDQSNARVRSLEELVKNLQSECEVSSGSVLAFPVSEDPRHHTIFNVASKSRQGHDLGSEMRSSQSLVHELRRALEANEMRYHEDQVKSTVQIQSAYEALENFKFEAGHREAELEFALNGSKLEVAELKANGTENNEACPQSLRDLSKGLLDSGGGRSRCFKEENKLDSELTKLMEDVMSLKASLTAKEMELQLISEENEFLRLETDKSRTQASPDDDAYSGVKMESVSEDQDGGNVMLKEEEDSRQSDRLEAAHLVNSELEAELRLLKIQSEQLRKAAEMATAILVTEDSGRSTGRSGVMHSDHYSTIAGKLKPAFSDDVGDESLKKKNVALKKIGLPWKKRQK